MRRADGGSLFSAPLARLVLAVFAVFALLAVPCERRAWAHAVGISRGEYTVGASGVQAELAFARRELAVSVPALDANGDGTVDEGELANERGRDVLRTQVLARFDVRGEAGACAPATLDGATLAEGDGVILRAHWTCPAPFTRATIQAGFLAALSDGHRHVARVHAGQTVIDEVLYAKHDRLDVSLPAAGTAGSQPSDAPRAPSGLAAFIAMGIEHILTGYYHLLFLFGLVLVRSRARAIVGVVTAFTLGHSITLALATLGVWAPSPRIVEPAIALSIAYVGVENVLVREASRRWRITFPFGLVHGFGFAGALREIGLPRAEVPAALVGFNVGVEIGQLAVLAVVLPLLVLLRRRAWFDVRGVPALSASIALAGVVWFVQRVWL